MWRVIRLCDSRDLRVGVIERVAVARGKEGDRHLRNRLSHRVTRYSWLVMARVEEVRVPT